MSSIGLAVRHARPFEHGGVDGAVEMFDEFVDEAGFADTVLTRHRQQHAALRGTNQVEGRTSQRQLRVASDDWAAAAAS
jgi:hypothetical protein